MQLCMLLFQTLRTSLIKWQSNQVVLTAVPNVRSPHEASEEQRVFARL